MIEPETAKQIDPPVYRIRFCAKHYSAHLSYGGDPSRWIADGSEMCGACTDQGSMMEREFNRDGEMVREQDQ